MLEILWVFFATVILDVAYVFYTRRTMEGRAIQAGIWAAVIWGLGAWIVIAYVNNHWLIMVPLAGSFIGTSVTTWWDSRTRTTPTSVAKQRQRKLKAGRIAKRKRQHEKNRLVAS
jgi:predicted tellurium resistance membrane protein TerC